MPSMGSFTGGMEDTGMNDYLLDHWKNETYLVAVPNANTAAGIILETGMPVMAAGGFIGSDPILTTDRLEKMVVTRSRYFRQWRPGDLSGNTTKNPSGRHARHDGHQIWLGESSGADPVKRMDR
jgi:4-amino-4-deoxy-L-arabinose transferase-like glycosyltransferase